MLTLKASPRGKLLTTYRTHMLIKDKLWPITILKVSPGSSIIIIQQGHQIVFLWSN